MTGTTYDTYEFKEYRYKDIDSSNGSNGYDAILKYKLSNRGPEKSLLPNALVEKFSFDNFEDHFETTKNITLPTIESTDNRNNLRDKIFDKNESIKVYYNTLDTDNLNPNNDIYVGYMIGVAKLVVEYFIYSSIVYGIMYTNAHNSITKPLITVSGEVRDDILEVYVEAMFNVEKELNMKNEVYHAYVADNIHFNNMYVKNNNLLKDKESSFNQRKSHLITMMSKNKKIKKQYANRSFWHMIYLIILIFYILTLVGVAYAGRSNLSVFSSMQKETMGMVLIIISSLVLTGMFSYGIFRRFFKN